MKILCLADHENEMFWDYFSLEQFRDIDLIISCGDLSASYLEFLATMTNKTVLYVRGNHDDSYQYRPPEGCICIEDTMYSYKGLRIVGLGGSAKYGDRPDMYTEKEMAKRIRKLKRTISLSKGFDLLVTHAPAEGYGDMPDTAHQGFACFHSLLEEWKIPYMIHGHVHPEYGHFERIRKHACGSSLINVYDHYILEFPEDEYPSGGNTGAVFYDWLVRKRLRRD